MPGQRVDGNDVAAVLDVLGEAVDRARSGGGPSLVEAHTYRMQAHTNADDDTRYRERAEVQSWVARDPLTRLHAHLTGTGELTPELEAEYAAAAEETATAMREALNADADIDPEDLFRFVTETRSPQLDDQWQMLRGEIERTADAAPGGIR
jgi:pyruvate dehydrogenase E1 component alpha subunit